MIAHEPTVRDMVYTSRARKEDTLVVSGMLALAILALVVFI